MIMTMKKKQHRDTTSSDRISNLPEPVKQHILSYLDTKTAVQTRILSTSWKSLTDGDIAFRNLDFSTALSGLTLSQDGSIIESNSTKKEHVLISLREGYFKFLDRAFESSIELDTVKLHVPVVVSHSNSRLNHWLNCAVKRRVKELEVIIYGRVYNLPSCVFNTNSITKLNLMQCGLQPYLVIQPALSSLRELCLQYLRVDASMMQRLFASLHNLEKLSISHVHGLYKLEITGLTKLQTVKLKHNNSDLKVIKIDAVNLLEFEYDYDGDDLGNDLCQIEVEDCKKLRNLELWGYNLNNLNAFLLNFPVLEHLKLMHCHNKYTSEISHDHLVHLVISHHEDLLNVTINTPNLKFFTYSGHSEITFLSKRSPLELTEATIELCVREGDSGDRDDNWYIRIVDLLAELSHCENLILVFDSAKDVMIPETVKAMKQPPLYAVKHLTAKIGSLFIRRLVNVIETLLWLAPCPQSISIYNSDRSFSKSLELVYVKTLQTENNCSQCEIRGVSCWRHSLDTVYIEIKGRNGNDTALEKFFKTARIDGKQVYCSIKNSS